jgi:hypothetical protein
MNNFQKLAQLSRDIELLENAGKFDAAEVLQRKFVREAQLGFSPAFPQVGKRQPQMVNMQPATTPGPNIAQNYDPMFDAPGTAYFDSEAPVTNFQTYAQGGTVAPQGQQQPAAQDNFQNNYTEQSDTANLYQQQNSNPNAQQESIEQKLYMNALSNIENALKFNDRNTAETIYNKTINQFQNPKRKQFFGNQIQRLRAKYLKPGNNQGPKQM